MKMLHVYLPYVNCHLRTRPCKVLKEFHSFIASTIIFLQRSLLLVNEGFFLKIQSNISLVFHWWLKFSNNIYLWSSEEDNKRHNYTLSTILIVFWV